MKKTFTLGIAVLFPAVLLFGWNWFFPPEEILVQTPAVVLSQDKKIEEIKTKTPEERHAEAFERSKAVKGLYMTADVASDPGAGAERLRRKLIGLADTTEINGMVIDVKEVCGPDYNVARLTTLIEELKSKNIWTIARIVVFKDASQVEAHPEWYLKRASWVPAGDECARKRHLRAKPSAGNPAGAEKIIFWQDRRGGYWLDPASSGARNYILDVTKKMMDLGFDELQFDYIRFPSDGDVQNIIYPAWDRKSSKCAVMKDFFKFITEHARSHKPDIILSADFFGYAAVGIDTGIGQCLQDFDEYFDYISFMTYPSHYYSGFHVPSLRGLPPVSMSLAQARANPGAIFEYSGMFARDFLDGKIDLFGRQLDGLAPATSTATTTVSRAPYRTTPSRTRLRPWIEDFYHEADKAAGRPWGAEKIRLQIEAAERVEPHGWLLWNAANIYTEDALRKE